MRLRLIALFVLVACQSPEPSWVPVSEDGRIAVRNSAAEVSRWRRELLDVKSSQVPAGARGSVIVDATVRARLSDDRLDQPRYLLAVDSILFGAELLGSNTDTVAITTPRAGEGGMDLGVGRRYRVLMIGVRGTYYSWDANIAPRDD